MPVDCMGVAHGHVTAGCAEGCCANGQLGKLQAEAGALEAQVTGAQRRQKQARSKVKAASNGLDPLQAEALR